MKCKLYYIGPLLRTLINFNPSMVVIHEHCKMCDELRIHSKTSTVEVLEWIINFTPYFMMHIITYLC